MGIEEKKEVESSTSTFEGGKGESSSTFGSEAPSGKDFLPRNIRTYIKNAEMMQVGLTGLKSDLDDFKEKIEVQKEELKKYTDEVKNDIERKMESRQLKTVETLGIFVALFTLVSIEFQIFKIYQNAVTIGGLTLILLGSLLVFITVLDAILLNDLSWENKKLRLIIIWFFFIMAGIVCFIFSPETQDKYVRYTKEDYGLYVEKYLTLNKSVSNLMASTSNIDFRINALEKSAITAYSFPALNKDRDINITELEVKLNKQQSVIDCFKKKKYWQYDQCLK